MNSARHSTRTLDRVEFTAASSHHQSVELQAPAALSNIGDAVDVDVPVERAYNQWTQFETFPHFMEGVESIEQLSDSRNRWTVEVGGPTRTFITEIAEQKPNDRIAWTTVEGDTGHAGVVTFHRLSDTAAESTSTWTSSPRGSSNRSATSWASSTAESRATCNASITTSNTYQPRPAPGEARDHETTTTDPTPSR